MKFRISIFSLMFCCCSLLMHAQSELPKVFTQDSEDYIAASLRAEAAAYFEKWENDNSENHTRGKAKLREEIIRQAGVLINQNIPLNLTVTGQTAMAGYSIQNCSFQTREGVYAPANIYIPEGKGPFPAVVLTHGHWEYGRRSDLFQSAARLLASNGYVCLAIDAWGAGERTTVHEQHEYHGANLGASLMNIGESLLGMQLTDNIRAVDLLSSLPYVDKNRIGATGASGGGNQAMWLAAIDKRIKAVVPVVSVGTFESYILNSNCVCELLPRGLTFTEEFEVLGLTAPRALKIITASQDANKAFQKEQMLRTYQLLKPLYHGEQADGMLDYQLFNTGHGYWPEMQLAMLDWFDLHLKNKKPGIHKQADTPLLSPDKLAAFPSGQRPEKVMTTAAFCRRQGQQLHQEMLGSAVFQKDEKIQALKEILAVNENHTALRAEGLEEKAGWKRCVLNFENGVKLPLIYRLPAKKNKPSTVFLHPGGRDSIAPDLIAAKLQHGEGVFLPDLWGTGENTSPEAVRIDGKLPPFHTLSRSVLWMGETVLGKWINNIQGLVSFMQDELKLKSIALDGAREAGLAALFFSGVKQQALPITARSCPISFVFDTVEGLNYFSMAVHLPGILNWGDLSLAAALSNSEITFIKPVTMSGKEVMEKKKTEEEFQYMAAKNKKQERTSFIW